MAKNRKNKESAPPEEKPREDELPAIPEELPVIPLEDFIVYPMMIVPIMINRPEAIAAMDAALAKDRVVLLAAEKKTGEEDPGGGDKENLHLVGTAALIIKMLKFPDGRTRVIVQGLKRVRILELTQEKPYFVARTERLEDEKIKTKDAETTAWMRGLRESMERAMTLGKAISPDLLVFASNVEEPGRLADVAATTLEIDIDEAQRILEEADPMERLKIVHRLYLNELQVLAVQQRISSQAKDEMEKGQREYFLRQQLKAIQQELGEGGELDQEIKEYKERIAKARMPDLAKEEAERQIKKLEKMHPDAAEAAVIRNYLDVVSSLPWSRNSKDRLDLVRAKQILDEDHYNLEKVKDRILEHLGVMKLKKHKMKGPILCFVGPPGVGKTSLGQSIARALNRRFVRLSLGGVRDEAEIRGHRRTYVGALPGRIIQSINQAGTNNPVFMMDEVDKIGADFRGDPSSALLEVLDPEQNSTFRDNYLGVDFDLSKVMFILTANTIETIQPAFRDRMEVLNLPGYTEEEKVQIAERYLIPRQRKANGVTANQILVTADAVSSLIKSYTAEAGVRNLEREIASICRKVARKVAEGHRGKVVVTSDNLDSFLGPPKIVPEEMLKRDQVGVATGLAWTPAGGDVLFVEAILMKGSGGLILTGQLGDVMQESAKAALSYTKAKAGDLGLGDFRFEKHDLHIHVPEGAIPKDGPSAGVTMAVALISAFTGKNVRKDIAMTGEITLRGTILPVGGIKEKVLAARRLGIKTIILPKQNEKDLVDIKDEMRKGMKFLFVSWIGEALKHALTDGAKGKRKTKKRPARKG
jgi:ATP-dependent Lon protease